MRKNYLSHAHDFIVSFIIWNPIGAKFLKEIRLGLSPQKVPLNDRGRPACPLRLLRELYVHQK
jgi:hypothetical protein